MDCKEHKVHLSHAKSHLIPALLRNAWEINARLANHRLKCYMYILEKRTNVTSAHRIQKLITQSAHMA